MTHKSRKKIKKFRVLKCWMFFFESLRQKLHILEYQSVCPLVGIGTPPTPHPQASVPLCPLVGIGTLPPPLSPASVPLPPEPTGGGAHSPAGEGLGESHFQRLEKKLRTLPTLCLKAFFVTWTSFMEA
jgi:hypothetical protein